MIIICRTLLSIKCTHPPHPLLHHHHHHQFVPIKFHQNKVQKNTHETPSISNLFNLHLLPQHAVPLGPSTTLRASRVVWKHICQSHDNCLRLGGFWVSWSWRMNSLTTRCLYPIGGGNSNIFFWMLTPTPVGNDPQFDEHIFQVGGEKPTN